MQDLLWNRENPTIKGRNAMVIIASVKERVVWKSGELYCLPDDTRNRVYDEGFRFKSAEQFAEYEFFTFLGTYLWKLACEKNKEVTDITALWAEPITKRILYGLTVSHDLVTDKVEYGLLTPEGDEPQYFDEEDKYEMETIYCPDEEVAKVMNDMVAKHMDESNVKYECVKNSGDGYAQREDKIDEDIHMVGFHFPQCERDKKKEEEL